MTKEDVIAKYQALSIKQRIVVIVLVGILLLLILPNTLVYALGGVAAYKFINKKAWKYTAAVFLGILTFFSGILWIAGDTPTDTKTVEITENQPVSANEEGPNLTPETAPQAQEIPQDYYLVVAVVDGDTLKVNIDGKEEALRLIGMDTPETVDPRKPVQCFAKEASSKAKETLTGKKVKLEVDPSQGERDKYDRLLRYLYLEDGTLYNQMMIEEGYAHEYTYNTPYKYQEVFKQAETRARESKKGFWGDICGGDTTQPAEKSIPVPTPAPAPEASTSQPSGGAGWACNCKKTCAAMSCQEAQYQLNSCGCSARDADKDGVACDSQCQ